MDRTPSPRPRARLRLALGLAALAVAAAGGVSPASAGTPAGVAGAPPTHGPLPAVVVKVCSGCW